MDSLNQSFGLTISTGRSGTERAWADLVRVLDLSEPGAATSAAVASRLAATGPLAARSFGLLLEELDNPADQTAVRISAVITSLGQTGLKPLLLKMESRERRRAAHAAATALTPAALIILAEAVGQSFAVSISQPLIELMQKLARESDTLTGDARGLAEQSFRSLIDHLFTRWSETQVNSDTTGYSDMFAETAPAKSRIAPEASRVVALSLESGAVGPAVWASLKEQSVTEAGIREVIAMVTKAPPGRAKQMLTEQITTPARLTLLLREEPTDFAAVEMMVTHLGPNAARTLLDELIASGNRSTRRAIMDALVKLGHEIAPFVNERLNDPRWYVIRNMITLLRECGCPIDQALIDRYAVHEDARVRREMLQLRMEDPATRDAALASGLKDKDKTVLRAALQAARNGLPSAAVSTLAGRVVESDYPPEFRVMSLYLLGKSGHVAALDALIAFASGGKTMLGKVKLANKTPEMLAALSGLARTWASDKRARELLDVAEKTKDPQILNALHAVPGSE